MQYRKIGSRVSGEYSALGFGCMRFPVSDGIIDIPQARNMLERALDSGVNYFDTAYPYHDGKSESTVGELLCKNRRAEFSLATKMPVWEVHETADFERIFNEQLSKLQTTYIDFYLVHAIDREKWERVRDLGIKDWLLQKQCEGKIRYKGFSFHGGPQDFIDIIDDWEPEWDFCQIQYNFMDRENQAGKAGLQYAAAKGIGVVIMEPLLGGSLAAPPEPVRKVWEKAGKTKTQIEWALQWLWNQNEVGIVLSGMSSMEQLEENIVFAARSSAGSLTKEECALFPEAEQIYRALRPVPCTSCGYCLPCPQNVAIPRVFGVYNDAVGYSQPQEIRVRQYGWIPGEEQADKCVECGVCMEKCPQGINIIDKLKEAHRNLCSAG